MVRSSASMAAPRPHPPKRNWSSVQMPGTTSRYQRTGLCVARRPRNSLACMGGCYGQVSGTGLASPDGTDDDRERRDHARSRPRSSTVACSSTPDALPDALGWTLKPEGSVSRRHVRARARSGHAVRRRAARPRRGRRRARPRRRRRRRRRHRRGRARPRAAPRPRCSRSPRPTSPSATSTATTHTLSDWHGQKRLLARVLLVVRLPLRPARVAGAPRRARATRTSP